jgi:hypothetical protein
MTAIEYMQACDGWTEIQYWDVMDDRFHSYLVEGAFLTDEVVGVVAQTLEEMPEGSRVFLTAGDVNKLIELEQEFEDYLIRDVKFITPTDIMRGHLRGQLGILMIIDTFLMTEPVLDRVYREQQLMKLMQPRGD